MQVIADLHLHSKFSLAVSKNMIVPEMSRQAADKGIDLLATGDWFHTIWMRQIQADLEEWSEGIYQSKENPGGAKFLLSAEISNIYKQGGQQRRVHTLVFSPNFSVGEKINRELLKRGCNLSSDGRPIIGLSVLELTELVFSVDEKCMLIPAHVWTPWYSLYGSKSGFDTIEECFGEFASRIFAVETGLSSDPAMNWRIEELERRAIVSCSDAHSGPKLGREATVFRSKNGISNKQISNDKFTYKDVYWAIGERFLGRNEGNLEISYTIEFYPEEGKYHFTGHSKCGVVQSPSETLKRGTTCNVCGKPLTVGVMHRVEELSRREISNKPISNNQIIPIRKKSKAGVVGYYHPTDESRAPYVMLVPLVEILGEVYNVGSSSKKVLNEYNILIGNFGSEFAVLLKTSLQDLKNFGGGRLSGAIGRVREGSISINPGYDGIFGTVKIWDEEDEKEKKEQMSLF
jgi:PHP family Zn ribbon phosphoesterase